MRAASVSDLFGTIGSVATGIDHSKGLPERFITFVAMIRSPDRWCSLVPPQNPMDTIASGLNLSIAQIVARVARSEPEPLSTIVGFWLDLGV